MMPCLQDIHTYMAVMCHASAFLSTEMQARLVPREGVTTSVVHNGSHILCFIHLYGQFNNAVALQPVELAPLGRMSRHTPERECAGGWACTRNCERTMRVHHVRSLPAWQHASATLRPKCATT